MIIKLPHIDPIDTLNLPEDFKTQVSNSFAKFTAGTDPRYTREDKLAYLDNLRKNYMIKYDSTEAEKSDNEITFNVIADIIKIVMNWKPFI